MATPSQGSRFDHWEGDAYGISNRITIGMDSNKQVTASFVSSDSVTVPTIQVATAKGILDYGQNVVFVDVRPQYEYESGHIPGAISIPFTELQDRYSEIAVGKQVIVYSACH
jgi:3-mercaptopyruvate sulfurtransferase SseA